MDQYPHMPAADDLDVDIGVIYTFEREFAPRLLQSVAASGDGLRMRLLLVDNVSDGVGGLTHYFPATEVLRNERRQTYASNLNRVLEASSARYVLLLNTDMYFDPEEQCLAKMARFMDQDPRCGIASCRLYHANGSYAFPPRRFQTPAVLLARRCGLARLMPGTLDDYLYRERSPQEAFECEWFSGCFIMLRREAYLEIGPFDAGFHKYFEDVDMCLRMARAGWRVMFNGGTYAYHLEQRASRRLASRDGWLHARSYFRWLRKWGLSPRRSVAHHVGRAC